MHSLEIMNPGLLTTVQDCGRYGYQKFGVPISGAMDRYSLRIANILVGNEDYQGCIEVTFGGLKIKFNEDSIIAITGANLKPKVNGKEVSMWRALEVKCDDVLEFAGPVSGIRSYISFCGGLDLPNVLNSKSTDLKSKLGGFNGRKLNRGDKIKIKHSSISTTKKHPIEKYIPRYENEITLNVILGPQDNLFKDDSITRFLNGEYEVTNDCDRMGYRLSGPKIEHVDTADIISDGVSYGAIQVPGSGQPIIMMADSQTTGGYTKIAFVVSSDLHLLAQAKPGNKIKFKEISIEDAHLKYKKLENDLEEIKQMVNCDRNIKEYKITVNKKEYHVQIEEIGM